MYCGGKPSCDLNETKKSGVSSSFPNVRISDTLHMEESASQLDDQNLLFPFYEESIALTSIHQGKVKKKQNCQKIIGLDNDTMHYSEYQDRSGFIPKESMKIP